MKQEMPTRNELLRKLDDLCAGSLTRDQAANWAISIINNDNIRITDEAVWSVLEGLGAADLPAPDRDYLFTHENFEEWKKS